jgi:GDP/UDP-N,N'-diacetylbacillosamine 2-epimerase (hydrolysing)
MAQLHFVAAEPYRRRVIQLGEAPERVFLVGGLGIDAIRRLPLLDRAALEQSLDFRLGARNLLITFHPVTLEGQASSRQQMAALLEALHAQPADTHLIFTMPNADTGGRELMAQVNEFVAAHPQARAYTSLGQLRYLSCLAQVDGVVGNSSSGLAEAPSFRCATVDIGDRQKGRLAAGSVIHCEAEADAIRTALARVFDPAFQASLASVVNPYGEGGASERILAVLRDHPLEGLLKKRFHDLPA